MATFSAVKKESEQEGVSETGEMDSNARVDGSESLLDVSQTIHQLFANSASAGSAGLLSPSQFLQASASAAISLPWLLPHYQQMLILQQRQQQQLLNTNSGEVEDGQLVMIPQAEEAQDTQQETSVIADSSPLISALLQRQVMAQLQQQQQQQQQNLIASGREVGTLVNLLGLQVPQVEDNARNVATSKQQSTIASESAPQRPKPPKKPLTPYMLFSKEHWHHVKAANSHLSTVTEIGAIIGSMWRELDSEQKLKYNERFTKDKIRYDEEIRAYLQNNNLSHSDLSRTRLNRKRPLSHHQQSQQLLNSAALTSTASTLLHNAVVNKPTSPTNAIATQQPIELQQQLGAATSLIGSWSNQSLQQILASMGFTNQMIYSQSDGNNVIGALQEVAESAVQQQETWKNESNRESPEEVESDQQTSPMSNHANAAEAKVWTWHHHHQQGDNSSENNLPMALTKSSASTLLNNITSVHGYNSRSSNEVEGYSMIVEKTENVQDKNSLSEKVAALEAVLQDKDEEIEKLKRKLEEAEMQIEQLKQNQPVQSAVSSSHSLDHPVSSSSRSSELEESPQQQQGTTVASFES